MKKLVCLKTITKKHKWEAVEYNASFTGTVGYDRSYALKCIACGIVNDQVSTTVSSGIYREMTSGIAYQQLLGKLECFEKGRHLWVRLDDYQFPGDLLKRSCKICQETKWEKKLTKAEREYLDTYMKDTFIEDGY